MRNALEIKKTNKGSIKPSKNVIYNIATPFSDNIIYDPVTGEVTLKEIGQYSVKWWVATEASLKGCVQFAVKSSQGDVISGCSPTKRGQIVGFGMIDAKVKNVKLSLVNMGEFEVFLSPTSPVTSAISVVREDANLDDLDFSVASTTTLEAGQSATAKLAQNTSDPNKWDFSFGIPKGNTGASPHIDAATGNWFIGTTNTGVNAKGIKGDTGPVGPMSATIPFCISKHGLNLDIGIDGKPESLAFSGFGISGYEGTQYLEDGEWESGIINIQDTESFPSFFVLPNDMTLKKIYALFSKREEYDAPTTAGILIKPFICLAAMYKDDKEPNFHILKDTMTYTDAYELDIISTHPVIKRGEATALNTKLTAGTAIAIVAGVFSENTTKAYNNNFHVSGGLYFE